MTILENISIFTQPLPLQEILSNIHQNGYCFLPNAIHEDLCSILERELFSLELMEGDHINYPINAGTKREVKQLHIRAYHPIGEGKVPVATQISCELAEIFRPLDPVLSEWIPTEAGYQLYRGDKDWISPHRDRRNDRLLSATITIKGSAEVKIYDYLDDPDDYTRLQVRDTFLTSAGTLMLLRAPGLGNGEQVIHEVCPPQYGKNRLILNLRSRFNVLKSPKEFEEMRKK